VKGGRSVSKLIFSLLYMWLFQNNLLEKTVFTLLYYCVCSFVWGSFFLWDWGLNSGLLAVKQAFYHLCHTSGSFCSGYFGDGSLANRLRGLASNCNPLSFQVARVTGVSHWRLACVSSFEKCLPIFLTHFKSRFFFCYLVFGVSSIFWILIICLTYCLQILSSIL
jgi:hypothetical protein